MLTDKQERFCAEYMVEPNALQAALRAGYARSTALEACRWLTDDPEKPRSRYKPEVAARIAGMMEELNSKLVASAEEVVQYLTSVLRGESTAEVIVVEGVGDGCSAARRMEKAPDEKERLKAAELLGKRYGIFTEKLDITGPLPVIINDLQGHE